MTQWEYRKIDLNNVPRSAVDIDLLMDAGKDGWELVGITTNNIAYLKRQIEESTPAPAVRRRAASSRVPSA